MNTDGDDRSYEAILKRMLDRVPANLDKREGSVIYDALAPAAAELAQAYIAVEAELHDVFLTTGSEETLLQRGAELGVQRREATAARVRGTFNRAVNIGERFNLEHVNYVVVEPFSETEALLQCETAGSIGNRTGTLFPIQYIEGLTSAAATEILEQGEDQESVEQYRSRLLEFVQRPLTSGNRYHYEAWAKEVNGAGEARCQPLWDGPGTVRVLLTGDDRQPATEALCKAVLEHIEEVRPVGAAVTVAPPAAKEINVSVVLKLTGGVLLDSVRSRLSTALKAHLADLVFARTYVSLALIGNLCLETEGVADYEALTLNGEVANIRLNEDEIPVLGRLEVSV